MKGRVSKKWGEAQTLYYQMNPDTKKKPYFNHKARSKAAIKALLNMSLGMWNDRCKVLHGKTTDEKNKIKWDKTLSKARKCFDR